MSDFFDEDEVSEGELEAEKAFFEQEVTLTMKRKELGFLSSLIAYQGTQINEQIKDFDSAELEADDNPAKSLCDLLETKFEMKNLLRIVLMAQGMPEEKWRSLHS